MQSVPAVLGGVCQLASVPEYDMQPHEKQDELSPPSAPHTSPIASHCMIGMVSEDMHIVNDRFVFGQQPRVEERPGALKVSATATPGQLHGDAEDALLKFFSVDQATRLGDCSVASSVVTEDAHREGSAQNLEMRWRAELATSQMREAGLRVEVEAARRELAEQRWNVLAEGGSRSACELEASEVPTSMRPSDDVLQASGKALHCGCSSQPSNEFLEARLAMLRHQLVHLHEEVAASNASERALRDEVLTSHSKQKAEVMELRGRFENAEIEAKRFRNEASEARSDRAMLEGEVNRLSAELSSKAIYEVETVSDLQTRLALMTREEGICRKEMSASALTVAMLRSEVHTAYHEASELDAKWREEFHLAQARWREELSAASELACSSKAKPETSSGASDFGGSLHVPQKMLRRVDSPQRLVSPPPGWRSRDSSMERASASSTAMKAKVLSKGQLQPNQSHSASSSSVVVRRSSSGTLGAPPPSKTPPVDHSAVPFAPWGLSAEATTSTRLLPAPRVARRACSPHRACSPQRVQPRQVGAPYLIQRMVSAPALRQTPLEACSLSSAKLPSECTTSAGFCSSSQRLTPTPRSSCSSPTPTAGSLTTAVAGEANSDLRRHWPRAIPANAVHAYSVDGRRDCIVKSLR